MATHFLVTQNRGFVYLNHVVCSINDIWWHSVKMFSNTKWKRIRLNCRIIMSLEVAIKSQTKNKL